MTYTARAFAKTNLFLDVLRKRPDGYHDIDTVIQSVSIYDEVSVELTKGDIEVFCDNKELFCEENIAAKACRLFFDYAKISSGALIQIKKNIPIAAGMGGGSADAAAVLLLLNKATEKNYSNKELLPLAKKLGADVPFFLMGGCARAQGIGEELTPLSSVKIYFVFLKDGEKQSTAQMYAQLDSVQHFGVSNLQLQISALEDGKVEDVCKYMYNSFEYCWDTEKMFKPFNEFKPLTTFISGSGPTVGAVFTSSDVAINCAETLKAQGKNAFYATSVDVGVEIV